MLEVRTHAVAPSRRRIGRHRVVIAGGSVAALEAMLALHHLAWDEVEVTLVSPRAYFEYRPLAVVEPFGGGPVPRYDLEALAQARTARFVRDAVASVDTGGRRVNLSGGGRLEYDFLVVAIGARAVAGVAGATPFWASTGAQELRSLVEDLEAGAVRKAVVAVPGGASWPLPAYELALQAARRRTAAGAEGRLVLVTPESAPLEVFGRRAGAAVAELLAEAGIDLVTGVTPTCFSDGSLQLANGDSLPADRVVSLPRLFGPSVPGLPHDDEGFIPVDDRARVAGVERVWAAGDAGSCPVKQGGIGAHYADVAAQAIALEAGARADATALQPVLRAVLFTGGHPLYLRRRLDDPEDPHGDGAVVARHPFWWPPDKIAGRYLAPFLARAQSLTSRAAV